MLMLFCQPEGLQKINKCGKCWICIVKLWNALGLMESMTISHIGAVVQGHAV